MPRNYRMDGNRVCRPEIGEQMAEVSTPHRNIANTNATDAVSAPWPLGPLSIGVAAAVATTAPTGGTPIGDYGKPTHLWYRSRNVSKHLSTVRKPFRSSALEPADAGAQRACLFAQPTAVELKTPIARENRHSGKGKKPRKSITTRNRIVGQVKPIN